MIQTHQERPRKLRILVREVHYGDGITSRQLKVYCKRRSRCVPVQECASCRLCAGFSLDPSGRRSYLRCTFVGETAASTPSIALEAVPTSAESTPISTVMTKDVVCVSEDMPIDELTRLLLDRGFSGVPVVDVQGNAVGVVTKTDLVREAYERPNVQEFEAEPAIGRYQLGPGFHTEAEQRGTVREIMTPITYTLKASTPLAQAAALMAFEGVHRLPIVADTGNEVVGLLSALDVLRWVGEQNGYLLQHEQEAEEACIG